MPKFEKNVAKKIEVKEKIEKPVCSGCNGKGYFLVGLKRVTCKCQKNK